jgi:hypothetical protein
MLVWVTPGTAGRDAGAAQVCLGEREFDGGVGDAVLVKASRGALNLIVGAPAPPTHEHSSITADILEHAECPVTVVIGAHADG